MEEEKSYETKETVSPAANAPIPDADGRTGIPGGNSFESEVKKAALGHRLAEAFREGVASTRPDYRQHPAAGVPLRAKHDRPESPQAGIMNRLTQDRRTAAAAVGEKAAGVWDSLLQSAKNAPASMGKYAEAFRAGAASVTRREGSEARREQPSADRKASETIRSAVTAAVKPRQSFGARLQIRRAKRKIDKLLIELGREAINAWGRGPLETEKVSHLLDEINRHEETIRNLQPQPSGPPAPVTVQGETGETESTESTATEQTAEAAAAPQVISEVAEPVNRESQP